MIEKHRLSADDFDALAAGGGSSAAIRLLKGAELSKRLLRIRVLLETADAATEQAYSMLADIQQRNPDVVRDVILYPTVGVWAAHCLRRIRDSPDEVRARPLSLAYLGSIAAAVAIRAGEEFSATVPVRNGVVSLPTLGSAVMGPRTLGGTAVVRSDLGETTITSEDRTVSIPPDPEADAPDWHGLRRLSVWSDRHTLEIYLDDLDPFRDRHGLGAAPRLATSEVMAWEHGLADAWRILGDRHPDLVEPMATGLTVIVPLSAQGGYRGLSATVTDALGAIAMNLPPDALLLAEGLVHEFQHVKLGALLNLLSLYNVDDGDRYYAPWRDDPRPLGGLLQGAYAYLGVTDFWRRHLPLLAEDDLRFGEFQFALWRNQTWRAIDTLLTSDRLKPLGTRFVEGMRAALAPWRNVAVRTEAGALADDAAADHALVWRLRHVQPDRHLIKMLAEAWIEGAPCPSLTPSAGTLVAAGPLEPASRADLRVRRVRSHVGSDVSAEGGSGATRADLAYLRRDFSAAVAAYRVQVNEKPEDADGWAGLVLALRNAAPRQTTDILSTHPEIAAALHFRVHEITGCSPDVLELVTWLGKLSST